MVNRFSFPINIIHLNQFIIGCKNMLCDTIFYLHRSPIQYECRLTALISIWRPSSNIIFLKISGSLCFFVPAWEKYSTISILLPIYLSILRTWVAQTFAFPPTTYLSIRTWEAGMYAYPPTTICLYLTLLMSALYVARNTVYKK